MEGVILDTLKYRKNLEGSSRIETSNAAVLIPYAQKEMVISFMEGSAPKYREALDTYLKTVFDEYPKQIIKRIPGLTAKQKGELRQEMIAAGKSLSSEFWKNIEVWAAKI